MKRKILYLIITLLLLALAVPAAAKNTDPVGERIMLYAWALDEFTAGEPVHIQHGWIVVPETEHPVGKWDFVLEINGVPQQCTLISGVYDSSVPLLNRQRLCTYPEGMPAGMYTLTGYWLAPCTYAAEYLGYAGTCPKPQEKVTVFSLTKIVTFVEP
jgi:hypothetical protein